MTAIQSDPWFSWSGNVIDGITIPVRTGPYGKNKRRAGPIKNLKNFFNNQATYKGNRKATRRALGYMRSLRNDLALTNLLKRLTQP